VTLGDLEHLIDSLNPRCVNRLFSHHCPKNLPERASQAHRFLQQHLRCLWLALRQIKQHRSTFRGYNSRRF
jgi:hypothetical protein